MEPGGRGPAGREREQACPIYIGPTGAGQLSPSGRAGDQQEVSRGQYATASE